MQAFWDKGGHNSWDRDHEFRLPAEVSSPSGPRDTMQSAASISSSVPEDLRLFGREVSMPCLTSCTQYLHKMTWQLGAECVQAPSLVLCVCTCTLHA